MKRQNALSRITLQAICRGFSHFSVSDSDSDSVSVSVSDSDSDSVPVSVPVSIYS